MHGTVNRRVQTLYVYASPWFLSINKKNTKIRRKKLDIRKLNNEQELLSWAATCVVPEVLLISLCINNLLSLSVFAKSQYCLHAF